MITQLNDFVDDATWFRSRRKRENRCKKYETRFGLAVLLVVFRNATGRWGWVIIPEDDEIESTYSARTFVDIEDAMIDLWENL